MKGNTKLIMVTGLTMISLLAYVNFNFELTGEGAAGPESNVSHTIASAEKAC